MRKRRKLTPDEIRQRRLNPPRMTLGEVTLNTEPIEPTDLEPFLDGTRWFGFEGVEYDVDAWLTPAQWDACVDDGARMLRCGHCGTSTAFNVRDALDVLCEGCGTTYMARPTDDA